MEIERRGVALALSIVAVLAAIVICLVNTLAAVMIAGRAMKMDDRAFSKIVLSSLVIRYFLILIFFGAGLKILHPKEFVFSLSFLSASFIFLMVEVLYINYKAKIRKFARQK